VTVRGQVIPVRSHLAEGEERAHLLSALKKMWPGYASYEVWASHRTLRIFRLTPQG
jgi:hypothetical protein